MSSIAQIDPVLGLAILVVMVVLTVIAIVRKK